VSTATLERPPQEGGEGDGLWAAIGEPSRRRLVDALLVRGESTPSALAADLPFTRQAVSKHLGVLDRAGLVEGRRAGREMRWAIRPEQLDAATKEMRAVADSWDRRLRLIKEIAEQIHAEQQQSNEANNEKKEQR
jgi:DNA-binding transcriptional ArsR family regulator